MLDLLVPKGTNAIAIATGNGDGTFSPFGTLTATGAVDDVVVCDHDKDGRPDVVAIYATSVPTYGLNLFLNLGGGNFAAATSLQTAFRPQHMVALDSNNDGKSALL